MKIEHLYELYLKHPNVCTDTRQINPGCLFFALKGANFDGNAFADQALEAGAAYVVVDDQRVVKNDRYLLVDDVLKSLQMLARHHRRQKTIPIVGITGSNGKTTTKELVAEVLKTTYPVHYTKGNLNNHIGVPLTLLSMPPETEIAIIEMGANQPGDIAELCAIAEPTHGLITNIGKAHLEGFGGLAGVKKTKSEMYRFLAKHAGLAFVNRDEKYLGTLSKTVRSRIFYGRASEENPNDPLLVVKSPFLSVQLTTRTGQILVAETQLPGTYNFPNILTAISVGAYFKVPMERIHAALEAYSPNMNRSQMTKWRGAEVILDAYNANPSSMQAALLNFQAHHAARKVAILGDMFELGEDSEKEHKKIYSQATKIGLDTLITAGTVFGKIAKPKFGKHFDTTAELKEWFTAQNWDGFTILLKGSRGMKLEQILD